MRPNPDHVNTADRFKSSPYAQRVTIVRSLIGSSRLFGCFQNDDIVHAAGLTWSEYWRAELSEPMRPAQFGNLLVTHLLDPTANREVIDRQIGSSLRLAVAAGETWIIPGDGDDPLAGAIVLRSLEAAKWFERMPKRQHLVPETLRAFLAEREKEAVAAQQTSKHRRSQKDAIREAVEKWPRGQAEKFKPWRRRLLKESGLPDDARGWSEDNIRLVERSTRSK